MSNFKPQISVAAFLDFPRKLLGSAGNQAYCRVLTSARLAVGEQLLNMAVGLVDTFLVGHLGAEAVYGATYLRIVSLTFLLASWMFIGNAALRGSGDTRTPMLVMLAVNVVNIISQMSKVGRKPCLDRL
jgi:hypothetical protein